jgi:hypothetical protein
MQLEGERSPSLPLLPHPLRNSESESAHHHHLSSYFSPFRQLTEAIHEQVATIIVSSASGSLRGSRSATSRTTTMHRLIVTR